MNTDKFNEWLFHRVPTYDAAFVREIDERELLHFQFRPFHRTGIIQFWAPFLAIANYNLFEDIKVCR